MDQAKIESFLAQNGEKLPADKVVLLKDALAKLTEEQFTAIQAVELKAPKKMMLIAWLGGYFGIDRFMMGQTGLGIAKWLTCAGCGIWGIIDIFSAQDRAKEFNYNKLKEALAAQGVA